MSATAPATANPVLSSPSVSSEVMASPETLVPRPFDGLTPDTVVYGVFDDVAHAERAAEHIVRNVEPSSMRRPQTDIHIDHMNNRDLPMLATEATRGPLWGAGVGIVGAGTISLAIFALSRLTDWAIPAQSPLEAGIVVLAGAFLGALAGGLAFASENRPGVRRLEARVENGETVVTVHGDREDREAIMAMLHRHGASGVGAIS